MSIDCQCRIIRTAQFSRAIDIHEQQISSGRDSLKRDAARVFRTAKDIAAGERGDDAPCASGGPCCGSCLVTVERMIQTRGHHRGEALDTAPDPAVLDDRCPFALTP